MGNIYYIMGKSSSGKDTLFQELGRRMPALKKVVPYTTRPPREGEKDGREYFFVSDEILERMREAGKVIELRSYHTVHGVWNYFTADDGQIDVSGADYLMIGTLESYGQMRARFGRDRLVPIYIEVEDGERLRRALAREESRECPEYKEMCRRFLADEEDFSDERLRRLEITRRFRNSEKEHCLEEITEVIRNGKL